MSYLCLYVTGECVCVCVREMLARMLCALIVLSHAHSFAHIRLSFHYTENVLFMRRLAAISDKELMKLIKPILMICLLLISSIKI